MEQGRKEKAPVPEEIRDLAAAEREGDAARAEARAADKGKAEVKAVVNRKDRAATRINRILLEKGT